MFKQKIKLFTNRQTFYYDYQFKIQLHRRKPETA